MRTDIQALRAVAVLLVVLYHLSPERLSGGYVGVDVFFVVSGFLITGHILREVASDGRVKLSRFWARRARRLLPASLFVCAASLGATLLWVPRSLWSQFFREILASVLYVQNWVLASDSIDYLAAENAPSPVQHFWSLAIEEQFYLIWPILIAVVVVAARRVWHSGHVRAVGLVIALICAIGLIVSVVWTEASPSSAYFATLTRMWEFGAGGLLAVVGAQPRSDWKGNATSGRALLIAAGVAAILVSAFVYDDSTEFPGWTALVPVIGTLLVIGVGPGGLPRRPSMVVDHPITQWVGDLSYSLYLWHWPLIVIAPYVIDEGLDRRHKLVILVLSFVLADLTKRLIEDPVRWNRWLAESSARSFGVAAVVMFAVGGAAGLGLRTTNADAQEALVEAEGLLDEGAECYGAAAYLEPDGTCDPLPDGQLIPAVAALSSNTGGAYSCYQADQPAEYERCTYGSTSPDALRVALVGDSHAAALLPGLWAELDGANWSLDTFVGRGCIWMETDPDDPICEARQGGLQEWFETTEPYDVIIVNIARNKQLVDGEVDPRSDRFAAVWRPLVERGTQIVAVADNPRLPDGTVDCLMTIGSPDDAERCTMARDVALGNTDPLREAVRLTGEGAHVVETEAAYCRDERCPIVIGNVIVYRDQHHITASFSRTLAPYLVRDIQSIASS